MLDTWQEVNNYYIKALNEAGVRFLKTLHIVVQVGQRKQVPPATKRQVESQMVYAIDFLRHNIETKIKTDLLKSIAEEKEKTLRALFYKGYRGMVAKHGWSGAYLKQAA